MTENEIGAIVVDTAVKIHRALGPGLLETVYAVVLAHELRQRFGDSKSGSDRH